MSNRSIIHLHIDSFFAEVERQRRPELAGKPIIVVKSAGRSAGVVVSSSHEAGESGVRESMTARHAQRLCPDGCLIAADYGLYREIHNKVMDIASAYSPLLEPYTLDSAYLDVTAAGNLFGPAMGIAGEIRSKTKESLCLDISAGVAANKFTAFAASSAAGPSEFMEVERGKEQEFLAPLPVRLIWGVGDKVERRLADLGVHTIGRLASIPERLLVKQFGARGCEFHKLACGVDNSGVSALYPPEIIIIEHMFPTGEDELEEPTAVKEYLPDLADRLAAELRKRDELARTITLKLYLSADGPAAARIAAATYHLKRSINSPIEIAGAFRRLLYALMRPGMKLSGVGLTLSGLDFGENAQLSLIGDKTLRMERDRVMSAIREKFGERAIFYAAALVSESPLRRLAA